MPHYVSVFSYDWTRISFVVVLPYVIFSLVALINLILYLNSSNFEVEEVKKDKSPSIHVFLRNTVPRQLTPTALKLQTQD